MADQQYTYQIQIFTASSANLEELQEEFPFRDHEGIVGKIILLTGDLNDQQREWLVTQKDEGKIKVWRVDPIQSMTTLRSRYPNETTIDDSRPSGVTNKRWLYAERKQGEYPEPHRDNSGKLLIFVPVARIDEDWACIKQAVEEGRLGNSAKVSTTQQTRLGDNTKERVICVYTYDWADEYDVRRIHAELYDLGFTWPISYKTNADTSAGKYNQTGYTQISKYRLSADDALAFKAGKYNLL